MTGREAESPPAFAAVTAPLRCHITTPPTTKMAKASQIHQWLFCELEIAVV
jgi:hypothetical protein